MAKSKKQNQDSDQVMVDSEKNKPAKKEKAVKFPKASQETKAPKPAVSKEEVSPNSKKRKAETGTTILPNKQSKTSDVELLYVGNIPFDAKQSDYQPLLEKCGTIEQIIWSTRQGQKFKGHCYVQYTTKAAVQNAFKELKGKEVKGRVLKIEISNRDHPNPPGPTLFVGNFPVDATDEEIKTEFSKFGTVQAVKRCTNKENAFVEFQDVESATKVPKDLKFNGNTLVVDFKRKKKFNPVSV